MFIFEKDWSCLQWFTVLVKCVWKAVGEDIETEEGTLLLGWARQRPERGEEQMELVSAPCYQIPVHSPIVGRSSGSLAESDLENREKLLVWGLNTSRTNRPQIQTTSCSGKGNERSTDAVFHPFGLIYCYPSIVCNSIIVSIFI